MMLILILINVQYLQSVFCIKKGSNGQNHSSSGSHHQIKKIPQQNFLHALSKIALMGDVSSTTFSNIKSFLSNFFRLRESTKSGTGT